MMNLSNFYARVFGFYLVIMAIGMAVKPQPIHNLVSEPNLLMGLGIWGLILGLAVVVSHQVWKGWPILITLIGYWGVIKAILIIFYPSVIINMVNTAWQGNHLQIAIGVDIALGLILLFCGYKLAK